MVKPGHRIWSGVYNMYHMRYLVSGVIRQVVKVFSKVFYNRLFICQKSFLRDECSKNYQEVPTKKTRTGETQKREVAFVKFT